MRRLLILTFFVAIVRNGFAAERTQSPLNIVFILIDDMGWTDGGCFGSRFYRTPNIDRLAASGMRFTQAYAACAVCSPTRAAIMTGKHPARLHITDWIGGEGTPNQSRFRVPSWRKELPLEEVTLAEAIKPLGFVSACIGKWHLGGPKFYPEHQGFDLNIAAGANGHPASYFWPYGKTNESQRVPQLAQLGGQAGEYLTDRLTDEALKFVDRHQHERFFLYLAHYALHAPLMGKEPLITNYAQGSGAEGQSNAVYAAMLESVDESVGRILKKLDELRIAEHTIVIFTSDNGGAVHFGKPPATSNSPLRLGKGYPYEGGLRVPLLVRAPGMTRSGSLCNIPVISQDFLPTLLELTGAEKNSPRHDTDGASFVPALKGGTAVPTRELFWHYPHYWNGKGALPVTPYSVIRSGDWKLIRFYESGTEELYNLSNDLSETRNLAAQEPTKLHDLSKRLDQWLHDVDAQLPVPR